MPAAFKRASTSRKRFIASTSSAAVGSSSTNTDGSIACTDAMATSCFSPPDSARMSRSIKRSMESSRTVAATRACISSCGTPMFSQPNATSEVVSKLKNWLRGFWNTLPTAHDRSSISHASIGTPCTSTSPATSPAYRAGMRPFTMRVSVVLPQPDGPVSTTHSPWRTTRFTSNTDAAPRACAPEPPHDATRAASAAPAPSLSEPPSDTPLPRARAPSASPSSAA